MAKKKLDLPEGLRRYLLAINKSRRTLPIAADCYFCLCARDQRSFELGDRAARAYGAPIPWGKRKQPQDHASQAVRLLARFGFDLDAAIRYTEEIETLPGGLRNIRNHLRRFRFANVSEAIQWTPDHD